MKLGQFVLAFGMGFLLFMGAMITENARYDLVSQVEDPFKESVVFEEHFISSVSDEPKEIFTSNGEFLRIFPGTEVDFSFGKRSLVEGELFYSSDFVDDSDFSKEKPRILKAPDIGQLKVDDLLINAPSASIFVVRDKTAEQIQIYTYNHSIELYWADVKTPFLVPPGMIVSIHEKLISEKTAQLFYSKLKKEFRLKPFQTFASDEAGMDIINKISISVEFQKKIGEKLEKYAKLAPETWFTIRPDRFTGKLVNIINKNAIGLSQGKKEEAVFKEKLLPLVEAHFAIKNKQAAKGKKHLNEFRKVIDSHDWKNLLEKNSTINDKWKRFVRAQKAWLRTVFPKDPAYSFIEFWTHDQEAGAFGKIEQEFDRIETLVADRHLEEAKKKLIGLNDKIKNIQISSNFQYQLTKRRRILKELLLSQRFLLSKEIFELYALLIEKESMMQVEDSELIDELVLESAQDVLFFLNRFLRTIPNPDISEVLLTVYNNLDVESIAKKRGRKDLFSEKEKEIIAFIKLAGSSGLTEEEMLAIKEQQAYQKKIKEKITALREKGKKEDTQTSKRPQISDDKNLTEFLANLEINVNSLEISKLKNGEFLTFANGNFLGEPVSGTFQVNNQTFKTIRIGEESKHGIKSRFLKGVLNVFKKSSYKASAPIQQKEIIQQNSRNAILQRTLVRELFQNEGFIVSKDNVKILDKEFKAFELIDAIFEEKVKTNFVYDTETEEVLNLKFSIGNKKFQFGSETFEREEINSVIEEKLEKYLKK